MLFELNYCPLKKIAKGKGIVAFILYPFRVKIKAYSPLTYAECVAIANSPRKYIPKLFLYKHNIGIIFKKNIVMVEVQFIHQYFNAEKKESMLFMLVGIIAVIIAILFFVLGKTNFYKGLAIPCVLIGLIHIVVGYSVYKRSDEQRKDIAYKYSITNGQAPTEEVARMQTVMKSFITYRYTEIALAIVGIVLVFLFRTHIDKQFWYGFGIALAIEALLTLGLDFFAERRGHVYVKKLTENPSVSTSAMNPNAT
jgi:hypothetical protein